VEAIFSKAWKVLTKRGRSFANLVVIGLTEECRECGGTTRFRGNHGTSGLEWLIPAYKL